MTRALIALVVASALAAVAAGVYVVFWNRDPVPNDVEACVRKAGLPFARSTPALARVRPDAAAGDLRVVRRWDWGRTKAVLLTGPQGGYVLLSLWNSDTPSLAGGDAGRRVYDSPEQFPSVVLEAPDRGVLRTCAQKIET